jgi:hypothetical protein
VSKQQEVDMSNAEQVAFNEMLRECEESLFSQQVGNDEIENEQEGE